MKYTVSFGHGSGAPDHMTIEAISDDDAIRQIERLVVDGYRNATWASADLRDGSSIVCRNYHGRARSQRTHG